MRPGRIAVAAFLFAASPLQAHAATDADSASVAVAYAEAIVDGCMPVARGNADLGGSTAAEDERQLTEQGFEYGIDSELFNRFGPRDTALISRSVMGHRVADEHEDGAVFVAAIGGAMPGCKVLLLTSEDHVSSDDVAVALIGLEPAWRQLPFANPRPGSSVSMRRFILRDADDKPFLINLIANPASDSEVRMLATLSPIPANVRIPEGY